MLSLLSLALDFKEFFFLLLLYLVGINDDVEMAVLISTSNDGALRFVFRRAFRL